MKTKNKKTKTMRRLALAAALLLILALLLAFDAATRSANSGPYTGLFDMRKSYIRRKHFTGTSAPPLMDSSSTMWYTFSLTRAVTQTLQCRRGSGC